VTDLLSFISFTRPWVVSMMLSHLMRNLLLHILASYMKNLSHFISSDGSFELLSTFGDLWGTSVNNAVLSVGAIYLQNVLWWSNVGGFQTLMFKNFVSKCVNVPPNCRDISICSE
jgi:hypothetical protein